MRSLITITCPVHGDFKQKAGSHLDGKGCAKCAGLYQPTTEEWVADTIKTRGNFYDYSQVEYVKKNVKIAIICPDHGKFYQTPDNHKQGQDCPNCASSGFKTKQPAWLYVLGNDDLSLTKIGITNNSVEFRAKSISRVSDIKMNVLLKLYFDIGKDAINIETLIKRYLKNLYKNVEKHFDGYTETFVDVDRKELFLQIAQLYHN